MKWILILIMAGFVGPVSFSQTYTGPASDIREILAGNEKFSEYYMTGNYEALADAYSRDAVILPPGTAIIKGRQDILKRWKLPDNVSVPYHKIMPAEIHVEGDMAYDIGYYEGRTLRADKSEVTWEGKYLIVWKKIDGQWKIYADAWNRME